MTYSILSTATRGTALLLACALTCGTVLAEKPDWAGGGKGGKGGKHGQSEQRDDQGPGMNQPGKARSGGDIRVGAYFGDQQRVAANNYYGQQFKAGKCPPGLAKKNNGCLPPGQAKKYSLGQPLPAGVVYYPVPSSVIVQLGAPPSGYKYVRVASDILLIALGTSMVVDAIQDLGRL